MMHKLNNLALTIEAVQSTAETAEATAARLADD
jgi:hypothetical protein